MHDRVKVLPSACCTHGRDVGDLPAGRRGGLGNRAMHDILRRVSIQNLCDSFFYVDGVAVWAGRHVAVGKDGHQVRSDASRRELLPQSVTEPRACASISAHVCRATSAQSPWSPNPRSRKYRAPSNGWNPDATSGVA
jgi:hypothetical protein